MSDTAIPLDHSFLPAIEFVNEKTVTKVDESVAELALHPGFIELERVVNEEIARLKAAEYQGEPIEQYGFQCLASSLCIKKLEWVLEHVRSTESAVRESRNTRD